MDVQRDDTSTRRHWWWLSRPALATLIVGLIVTGSLSWISYVLNDHNETRLLNLQTREAGALLQVVVPAIETPLASAAQIAETTKGEKAPFTSYMQTYVGKQAAFASVSLWRVSNGTVRLITVLGIEPVLSRDRARAATFLAIAARKPALQVAGPLRDTATSNRLGYAYASGSYVAYAESPLPPNGRAPVDNTSPLSDLWFALYLGPDRVRGKLLESDAAKLPITGRTASVTVPFGTNALTLVTSPKRALGGGVPASLWWIVAAGGTVLAIGATLLAERLARRRQAAEALAVDVQRLLGEQRTIAEALQQALLPSQVASVDGADLTVRYRPGEHGVELGGDWYDVVPLDAQRFFFVVGDVSGRGISAGAVMASLRFAIRGFVSEGYGPGEVLDRLAAMVDSRVEDGDQFATVLCGVANVPAHEVTFANAGHLPPLLVAPGAPDGEGTDYVDIEIGPPIGVAADRYRESTVHVGPGATVVVYTDGLVERRDESLDRGLERLRAAAREAHGSLDEFVDAVMTQAVEQELEDDTALLAVRWRS